MGLSRSFCGTTLRNWPQQALTTDRIPCPWGQKSEVMWGCLALRSQNCDSGSHGSCLSGLSFAQCEHHSSAWWVSCPSLGCTTPGGSLARMLCEMGRPSCCCSLGLFSWGKQHRASVTTTSACRLPGSPSAGIVTPGGRQQGCDPLRGVSFESASGAAWLGSWLDRQPGEDALSSTPELV